MARPKSTPWKIWGEGFAGGIKATLTFAEVNAIQQAWKTGRFSKASLARIYDIYPQAIDRVIAGTYRYHREK